MTNPLEFPPTLNFPKVQIPQYLLPFGMKIVRETLEHPWPIDFDESLVNRINFEDPTFLGEHLNRCIIYLDHNVPSFKEIEQDQKKHIGKEYSEYILALLRAFIELVSIAKKIKLEINEYPNISVSKELSEKRLSFKFFLIYSLKKTLTSLHPLFWRLNKDEENNFFKLEPSSSGLSIGINLQDPSYMALKANERIQSYIENILNQKQESELLELFMSEEKRRELANTLPHLI